MEEEEETAVMPQQSAERQDTPESLHLPEHTAEPEQLRAGVKQRVQRRKHIKADQPSETVVVKETFLEWLRVRAYTWRRARVCVPPPCMASL
jgi:hypothetical protein